MAKNTERKQRHGPASHLSNTIHKEMIVLGCVDTVNSEAVLFSNYRKWFGASYEQTTPKKNYSVYVAVQWQICETGSRQKRKFVSNTKKMPCSKMRNVHAVQR